MRSEAAPKRGVERPKTLRSGTGDGFVPRRRTLLESEISIAKLSGFALCPYEFPMKNLTPRFHALLTEGVSEVELVADVDANLVPDRSRGLTTSTLSRR